MGTHPIFESDFDCLTDPFRATQKLKMRYVAAYLLAQLGGNAGPDADAIKAILSSVGVDADEEKLSKVISELAGKNIDDVLAEGKAKLASVPSVVEPVQPPLLVPPPRRHPRRRRRRRHPSLKMTIWDSTCSDNIHLC